VFGATAARREGDESLARTYEAQQADEVLHVRFANDWIREQVARQPLCVLQMARALTTAAEQFQRVFAGGTGVTKYTVDAQARSEAGFTEAELQFAGAQAEARRDKARFEPPVHTEPEPATPGDVRCPNL
jgi:uncharacterized ferritin-like protein (DUF455 family)